MGCRHLPFPFPLTPGGCAGTGTRPPSGRIAGQAVAGPGCPLDAPLADELVQRLADGRVARGDALPDLDLGERGRGIGERLHDALLGRRALRPGVVRGPCGRSRSAAPLPSRCQTRWPNQRTAMCALARRSRSTPSAAKRRGDRCRCRWCWTTGRSRQPSAVATVGQRRRQGHDHHCWNGVHRCAAVTRRK